MNATQITTLRACASNLKARDAEFALSLVAQYERKGSLSDRQWPYVEQLLERAQPQVRTEVPAVKPAKTINLQRLQALFEGASKGLNKPRVAFSCDAGEFMVSRAADNSRNPGHLYVKAIGGEYLGKVDPAGALHMAASAAIPQASVFSALEAFAANPAAQAAAYGQATGTCCFCYRRLTDARSVEVGYGPICADHWGLPWGL